MSFSNFSFLTCYININHPFTVNDNNSRNHQQTWSVMC